METKGPTLEEIARIFDGASANVGLADIKEVPGLPVRYDYRRESAEVHSAGMQLQDWDSRKRNFA